METVSAITQIKAQFGAAFLPGVCNPLKHKVGNLVTQVLVCNDAKSFDSGGLR